MHETEWKKIFIDWKTIIFVNVTKHKKKTWEMKTNLYD